MSVLRLPRLKNAFPAGYLVTSLGFIDTHLLIPVVALYAVSLGAGVGVTGLIIGLYSIANTPANLFFGRLVDRAGYKRPLVLGLVGDAIAMFCYAMCRLPLHLAFVRVFHGITGGVVGPATMSATVEHAAASRKGRVMGLYGSAMAAATLLGYGLGGVMASKGGFHLVFYVGSGLLLAAALVSMLMPGMKKPVVAAKTSMAHDLRRMVGLLRRRGLVTSYWSIFTQYFAFGAVVTLLPLYVKSLGLEALHVGLLLGIFAVTFFVLQFPSGTLSDRVGRRLPITSGLGLCVVALVAMPAFGTLAVLGLVMALYGAAYALIFPSISALVAEHTSSEERGSATGIFHALLTVGVAIGAPVMGAVAQYAGIRLGLALCSSVAALALLIAWADLGRGRGSLSREDAGP
ncbi:MAG: MFS transporter [Chloroflexota bacterium]|nr:MFS transporter [Chloroflexota bacterium]